jgi:steroid delta-isomerase-like uncharacterized protein
MPHHENIACRWFERVWNNNEAGAISELGTPDMKAHGADGVLRTPEMFAEFQRAMQGAMPDVHVEVRHCVQGGDTIAVHWFATGTHTGAAEGLPEPSGRRIEVSGLTLVRLAPDGRIAEGWDDYDFIGLMRQLGASV